MMIMSFHVYPFLPFIPCLVQSVSAFLYFPTTQHEATWTSALKGTPQQHQYKRRYPKISHEVPTGGIKAHSTDEVLNVVITGANRGLGFAIAQCVVSLGHRVVLACRNEQKGRAALERLIASHGDARSLASVHVLDVSSTRSIDSFLQGCIMSDLGGRLDLLFNNAGVCLPGWDKATLESTLGVNFFGALHVMEACLPALTQRARTQRTPDGAADGKSGNGPPSVVWISSGDGELCFLGSKWQRLIERASSLEEIELHLARLVSSTRHASNGGSGAAHGNKQPQLAAHDDIEETEDEHEHEHERLEEIAFGHTPAYSLSKATGNAVVRLLAPSLADSHGVRLVAVCPGDVLTDMTSPEELIRGEVISPLEAARAVVDVALRARDFPTGGFYRRGESIPW